MLSSANSLHAEQFEQSLQRLPAIRFRVRRDSQCPICPMEARSVSSASWHRLLCGGFDMLDVYFGPGNGCWAINVHPTDAMRYCLYHIKAEGSFWKQALTIAPGTIDGVGPELQPGSLPLRPSGHHCVWANN